MNVVSRFLFVLLLGLAASARAQGLLVATNTLETGTQSYNAGVITNGATYTVAGSGASVAITNSTLQVGRNAAGGVGNLMVTNGAMFSVAGTSSGFTVISPNTTATSSLSVVGSTLNSGPNLIVGDVSSRAGQVRVMGASSMKIGGATVDSGTMLISEGSQVVSTNAQMRLAVDYAGATAQLDVAGPGTLLYVSNSVITVGRAGLGIFNIRDGAVVSNTQNAASNFGNSQFGTTVAGGTTGILTVANGGKWISSGSIGLGNAIAGTYPGGVGLMTVQGTGSYVQAVSATLDAPGGFNSSMVISNGGYVSLGSQISVGSGTVFVASGGILESGDQWNITASKSGSISNVGGIYQFTTPFVTLNTFGRMVLTDGTISFRNRSDIDVYLPKLTNITFNGQNTFRMDAASNGTSGIPQQNYTFNTGLGATNYVNLELLNGANWRNSAWLTIGAGGSLLVSNSGASRLDGVLTNQGAIRVLNSKVSYASAVVLSGSYFSDPSTNTFDDNLTVTASGSLYGSNGDLFVFNKNFINQSTNRSSFDLAFASLLFTNGTGTTNHLFSLTGSDALDKGSNWLGIADLATNFAVGTLSLAAGNTLSITGAMGGGVSNALYVGTLDLQGLTDTNQLASRLWLGINLYYDEHQAGNAYLHGLTYDLPGAGLLIPIPEPSALAMIAAGLGLLVFLRRRA